MTEYFAGVDIGSSMTKVVIFGETMLTSVIRLTSAEHRRLANEVVQEALDQARLALDDITYIVATGYGRINVPFADKQITEITCHARGVSSLIPTARTVIDIGGQDSKGIKIANGRVVNFVMNDKCAAGTGRFLEVMAKALDVKLEEIGDLSLSARKAATIGSICTVFAEQEAISLLAEGAALEDVIAGLHEAFATRINRMVQPLKIERETVITGGGAKNIGLVRALEARLGCPVLVPDEPLLTGAIGAALLGKDICERFAKQGLPLGKVKRRLQEARFFS